MNDFLVVQLLRLFRMNKTQRNHDILFTILYNFVPAFIFAPYLVYVGLLHDLLLALFVGVALFVVDTLHFAKAIRELKK